MPRFILHRIVRMNQNPGAENITPGLEAAMYLHWLTCYERDPKKFACLEAQVSELRKNVAEYFELTAQETTAHLELMEATHAEDDGAAKGTKDFRKVEPEPVPGPVHGQHLQFGHNWTLLYWTAPEKGGKPWGYRIYRRETFTQPELVATVCEPEVLLPDQPEGVKFHYTITAFNGSGESDAGACVCVMFNAPEDEEETKLANERKARESAAALPHRKNAIPPQQRAVLKELGAAMLTFVQKVSATWYGEDEDSVMRQVATEEYRQAVEKAASQGAGTAFCWHTLGVWTEEGKERIGCFSRALDCLKAERAASPPMNPREQWADVHTEADCLFEIGRVHFHEGPPQTARQFLSQALPLAQRADALRADAGIDHDDNLEGRIAELLLQLPDE